MKTFIRFFFCFAAYFVVAVSCSKSDSEFYSTEVQNQIEEVLQERNPDYPFMPSNVLPGTQRFINATHSDALLGYSYSLKYFPVEDSRNIGFPVINTEKLYIDHPGLFSSPNLNHSTVRYSSFYDFSRFESNYTSNYTGQSGFGFGIGPFSASFQSKFTESFSSTNISESEAMYGYMHIAYERKLFKFNTGGNAISLIRDSYLHPDFLFMVHNTSTDEFLSSYGAFVLYKYILGGIADAYFIGKKNYVSNQTESQYEEQLSSTMSLGFSASADASLSYQENSTHDSSIVDIEMFLETMGGLPEYTITTSPADLKNFNIDLSGWCTSLGDINNLVVSSIDSTSLLPIHEFIEEENIKEDFIETMISGTNNRVLNEPSILLTIDRGGINVSTKMELRTRRGEYILLREKEHFSLNTPLDTIKMREYRLIKSYFPNIRVLSITRPLLPLQRGGAIIDPSLLVPAAEQFNGVFNLRSMKKFVDEYTGKTYLLSTTLGNEKYAFTLFDEGIIRDYTFDDFINSLDTASDVDIDDIRREYIIIGL